MERNSYNLRFSFLYCIGLGYKYYYNYYCNNFKPTKVLPERPIIKLTMFVFKNSVSV